MSLAHRQPATDPGCADHLDGAQFTRADSFVSLAVIFPVALLVIDGDALGLVSLLRRGHHSMTSCDVDARGLLHEDVFAGVYRGLELLRVQLRRRGDVYGVDVAGQ